MHSRIGAVLRAIWTVIEKPLYELIILQAGLLLFIMWRGGASVSPIDIACALTGAVATEFLLSRKLFFPGSAFASALGIGIFLRATNPLYFALAGCIAIASKYFIRKKNGHIFNPSNIAVVAIVFLFPSVTTIEFTQWGSNIYAYALIAAVSFLIAYRAGVLTTTVSFLSSYTLLLVLLLQMYPDTLSFHHYGLLGPSLVLFASFMITDPKTSPRRFGERVLHGVAVAIVFIALEVFGVRYALFAASFLVTCMNACSALVLVARRTPYALPWGLANLPTFALACVICLSAITLDPPTVPHANGAPISPDFLLRGVESPGLLRCSNDAALRKSDTAVFAPDTGTFGAAWGDYNNDGYDDLFVSNVGGGPSRLYRNNGDGTFTDVTAAAGLPEMNSWSAVFVDYDNDGKLDLFVAPVAPNVRGESDARFVNSLGQQQAIRVFRNVGNSKFVEVTHALGFGSFTTRSTLGDAFSFDDYDGDGDLDFVFATAGSIFPAVRSNTAMLKSLFDPRFELGTRVVCDATQVRAIYDGFGDRALGSKADAERFIAAGGCLIVNDSSRLFTFTDAVPSLVHGTIDALWLMPGELHLFEQVDGKFVEHTGFSKKVLPPARSDDYIVHHLTHPFEDMSLHFFQPVSFDYDGDGKQDIFVTLGWGRNLLLRNEGAFSFSDVTAAAGLDYGGSGMGVAVGDFDANGTPDIFTTNVFVDYLFSSNTAGTFVLANQAMGAQGLGWGTVSLDYDLDGKDDIFVVNGDVSRTILRSDSTLGRSLFRSDRLYRNEGDDKFADVTWTDMCSDMQSGKAAAVSDYDNNGTPDVFVGNASLSGGSANTDVLYVDHTTGASFLKVRLKGKRDNSFGIGATVSVTSDLGTQTKVITAGDSFYSSDSPRIVFGLGKQTRPVRVHVVWPSGAQTDVENVAVDQEITVAQ